MHSLGKKIEALRYLNTAYEERDGALLFVEVYPEFESPQAQAAYDDLIARMKLPDQLAR